MNSLKMKISVILGVANMLLGTCMKGFNAIYNKDYIEFVFEVITQFLLLLVLFGFMDYMIILKWLTNWEDEKYTSNNEFAPGIINTMIIMFINVGNKPPPAKEGDPVQADLMPNQKNTMILCLITAAFCVPLMLFVKPLYVLANEKSAKKAKTGDDFDNIANADRNQIELAAINAS